MQTDAILAAHKICEEAVNTIHDLLTKEVKPGVFGEVIIKQSAWSSVAYNLGRLEGALPRIKEAAVK